MPADAAVVTLDEASTVVDAAMQRGLELGLAPLTVVVLDPGGHLVVAKRSDGAGIMRADVAFAKAWGVLAMGWPARVLVDRAARMPQFFSALAGVSGGRMVPVAGGVPIHDTSGRLVGSAGVSGDTSENDELCAVAGIEAAGLTAWLES